MNHGQAGSAVNCSKVRSAASAHTRKTSTRWPTLSPLVLRARARLAGRTRDQSYILPKHARWGFGVVMDCCTFVLRNPRASKDARQPAQNQPFRVCYRRHWRQSSHMVFGADGCRMVLLTGATLFATDTPSDIVKTLKCAAQPPNREQPEVSRRQVQNH